jgi:hypothetical protein
MEWGLIKYAKGPVYVFLLSNPLERIGEMTTYIPTVDE